MKKLIFFAYDLNVGGIENALINLLNHIDYSKYDVTLVLEHKKGDFLPRINKNVDIYEYKLSESKNIFYRKLYNFIKRMLWSLKNKNKYDFSCCYATYSLMGSKLSKIASENSCIYVHSNYRNIYDINGCYNFFNERGITSFKHIIFVSNESRISFNEIYPDLKNKTMTINNFIDKDKILTMANEKIEEQKHNKILFTFVGRLEEASKKVTRLLSLMKNLKSLDIELWIIGDGPDKKLYEDIIKKDKLTNVFMLGKKTNPYPYMKKSDYVILTSEYEGFPVVYLEAIILNKNIITTIPVSDEYFNILDYGYVVSKDINKLTDEVKKILENKKMKYDSLDFEKMNQTKIDLLEKLFDNEI